MKIKFKKEVPEDARWTEVLTAFLKHLSKVYGYSIDAYDVSVMPESVKLDNIGALVDKNPESQTYSEAFHKQCNTLFKAQNFAAARRKRDSLVAKALTPEES